MEQGKIDSILSSRPEDRRAIFEEAAGITKYKSQKKEALRKLENTEANLIRLADIIREVKRQIGSLQRQAGKARRYRALFRAPGGGAGADGKPRSPIWNGRRRGSPMPRASFANRRSVSRCRPATARRPAGAGGEGFEARSAPGLMAGGEGFSEGAQAVLRGLDNPDLFKPAVLGALAQFIEVPTEYVAAVEAALGAHLQTIVMKDTTIAEAMIKTLIAKKMGRASLALREFDQHFEHQPSRQYPAGRRHRLADQ
jgi:chromosome segregation ATPase